MREFVETCYPDLDQCSPHIWLGVTAENQRCADERIPWLLQTPAAVRFVSVEPCLEPVDVAALKDGSADVNALTGERQMAPFAYADGGPRLSWIICGAETGPGARPMDLQWARDLRDQCRAAGIPFFWKRAGPGQETPPDLMVREWPKESEHANRS